MTPLSFMTKFLPPLRHRGLHGLAAFALCVTAGFAGSPRAAVASPEERSRPVTVIPPPAPPERSDSGFPQGAFGANYLDLVERYLDLMQKFTRLAEDPAGAGIAGVFGSKDLLGSDSDPAKAIEFFNSVLPEVKNEAVQRAIHLQLIDLYKKSGQRDKALDQLRILITSAPAEAREGRESSSRDRREGRDGRTETAAPATR